MAQLGLGVKDLALAAGLSRQTVHALLRPGFRPLLPSVDAVAAVLGLDPAGMLRRSDDGASLDLSVGGLLSLSAAGNPRAFELLPARLISGEGTHMDYAGVEGCLYHQLLAAAAEMASSLVPSSHVSSMIPVHAHRVEPHRAFFFGRGLMSPDRIVQVTPEPLKKHQVFGAFSIDDFARHL